MQVGDLVKVRLSGAIGLVLEVKRDKFNCVVIVQPARASRLIYTNPVNVEVINASR